MEVVFEIVNRANRTLERHRAGGEKISIGRAYDNDLILSDETVSPHHAVVESRPDGGPVLIDLNSLNGIRCDEFGPVDGSIALRSGGEYSFGRALVRIYDIDHPVAQTALIGGTDGIINRLGSTASLTILIGLALLVAIFEQWLTTYTKILWQEIAIGVFGIMAIGVIIAAFWAILGRVIRHEGRFQTQFALVMAYLLIQSAIVSGYELMLFNSLSRLPSAALLLLVSFAALSYLLWLCLHVATHLASRQRWRFAMITASVMLVMSIYPAILKQTEFSASPEYIKEVKPPFARFTQGRPIEDFVKNSAALFKQTNHDE